LTGYTLSFTRGDRSQFTGNRADGYKKTLDIPRNFKQLGFDEDAVLE
jgi:hypothetical protein